MEDGQSNPATNSSTSTPNTSTAVPGVTFSVEDISYNRFEADPQSRNLPDLRSPEDDSGIETDDFFLSWGGLVALGGVLLAGGLWRLRRRRRVQPREPQVLGRLLEEVEEQELVPATSNGYALG
mmetsp:Transcript_72313/g.159716  ORF Transcript_72313/g.159716 Transcript_72313/m.159716 type:complete len:124 (+) Transcript_72313:77-448(+)